MKKDGQKPESYSARKSRRRVPTATLKMVHAEEPDAISMIQNIFADRKKSSRTADAEERSSARRGNGANR